MYDSAKRTISFHASWLVNRWCAFFDVENTRISWYHGAGARTRVYSL